MICRNCKLSAFSLVEVTLALGVAGFCLIAVFGLLPVGVQTNQRAVSQTAATAILSSVIADMRVSAKATSLATQSQLFKINIPAGTGSNLTPQTLYFDSQAACSTDINGSIKPGGGAWSPALQVRYRLSVKFPSNGGTVYGGTYASLLVTWPAVVDPFATQLPGGSSEMFAALSRN
jgi:type II secretory pathway pseudopilin PulG